MPRDGSGASDNAVEAGETKVHGVGSEGDAASTGVDRSNKAVAPPEPEKGDSIEGMAASGGGSAVTGMNSGKGPEEATVDKEAQKH